MPRCEDCPTASPRRALYGLKQEGRFRWCGACRVSHLGAYNLQQKRCRTDDCEGYANFGARGSTVRVYCGRCSTPMSRETMR